MVLYGNVERKGNSPSKAAGRKLFEMWRAEQDEVHKGVTGRKTSKTSTRLQGDMSGRTSLNATTSRW